MHQSATETTGVGMRQGSAVLQRIGTGEWDGGIERIPTFRPPTLHAPRRPRRS